MKTSRPPWTANLGAISVYELAGVMELHEAEAEREGLPMASAERSTDAALGLRVTA